MKVVLEVLLESRGREGGVRREKASMSRLWFWGSDWEEMRELARDR